MNGADGKPVRSRSAAKSLKTVFVSALTTLVLLLVWSLFREDNPWPAVYSRANPTVVEIHALALAPDGLGVSFGTGFVFRSHDRFVVLTNRHVVATSDALRVRFADGVEATGRVLDASTLHDLAIVEVEGVRLERYGASRRGDSSRLRIGDPVLTIGHPVHESHHISVGFYTGRFTDDDGRTLLRLSMAVDPGNSGGPVLDRSGRVVGVVSQKVHDSSNIAFAIPIERVDQLESTNRFFPFNPDIITAESGASKRGTGPPATGGHAPEPMNRRLDG